MNKWRPVNIMRPYDDYIGNRSDFILVSINGKKILVIKLFGR